MPFEVPVPDRRERVPLRTPLDHLIDFHTRAAGSACTDRGDGLCEHCGVILEQCPECGGVGYHRVGCADGESE